MSGLSLIFPAVLEFHPELTLRKIAAAAVVRPRIPAGSLGRAPVVDRDRQCRRTGRWVMGARPGVVLPDLGRLGHAPRIFKGPSRSQVPPVSLDPFAYLPVCPFAHFRPSAYLDAIEPTIAKIAGLGESDTAGLRMTVAWAGAVHLEIGYGSRLRKLRCGEMHVYRQE